VTRDHDAVNTRGIRRPEDRSQVVGIVDAVQADKKRRPARSGRPSEQIIRIGVPDQPDLRNDSLVIPPRGHALDLGLRHESDLDPFIPGQAVYPGNEGMPPSGDQADPLDRPA
jgi:hypothetical protein